MIFNFHPACESAFGMLIVVIRKIRVNYSSVFLPIVGEISKMFLETLNIIL